MIENLPNHLFFEFWNLKNPFGQILSIKKTLVRRGQIWGVSKYQHSISQKIASEENVWIDTSKFLLFFFFFFFGFCFGGSFLILQNVCSKNIFYNWKKFISLISCNQRKVRRKKDLWGKKGCTVKAQGEGKGTMAIIRHLWYHKCKWQWNRELGTIN